MAKKAIKASAKINEITKKARQLFLNEQAEAALELLNVALREYDHVRLWRLKARILVFFDREVEATEILRRIVPMAWYPGFWELVQSGMEYSNIVSSTAHKLAYFPIPKCGSTSIQNAFAILSGRVSEHGEVLKESFQYNLINRLDKADVFADYKKILLVRSPLERIRSYYNGNIIKYGHLVRDTGGKDTHYGLKTKPDYSEFIDHFHAYRRTFLSVRNHTDPIVGFVGDDLSLFDWVGGVQETGGLIAHLSEITGMALPRLHDMQSTWKGRLKDPSSAEGALLEFYAADIKAYEGWF